MSAAEDTKMLKSTVAITYELDDIQAGVSELADETLKNLTLQKNSFALLLCDSDVKHEEFVAELRRKLGVPIVGFSTTAMFSGGEGLCDGGAILTTVTSDDVNFSLATSEPLTPDNVAEEIEKTYKKALAGLDGAPELIMAFPPYILGIMLDTYPREFSRVSGGVPIFGGLPAHDEVNGRSSVYCGDTASGNRVTALLLSGAVKPVMTVKNSLGSLANLKRTVTRSKDNVVYSVGDDTFVHFLEQFGLDVTKLANPEDKTTSFTTYPLLLELANAQDLDGVPIVRTLHGVNLEDGSGTAIGEVPEGCTLSVGVLQPHDIDISTQNSTKDLIEKMKENERGGYRYSTVFAVSCVARYYVMASKNTLEADALKKGLPPELSLSGFYSFGEICPTSVRSGKAANAAHNESLVLLAL
ncbi:MAG: FIST C-terminal domain-containing protein [Synergistaceae bacterium]|jgi:hypothetical protein|nr:FIST C-terminal domain-containing protein [Synergistaceae bacterium]